MFAMYLANDGEIAPELAIELCWRQNKNVYLPVLDPNNKGHLLFQRYDRDTPLPKNKYGIPEPEFDQTRVIDVLSIDILFMPLVSFDHRGNRLGMGGGYYDRTLAAWYQNREKTNKPYPIGLAHDCQLVDQLPTASWDIPIPEIFTPTKHFQFF